MGLILVNIAAIILLFVYDMKKDSLRSMWEESALSRYYDVCTAFLGDMLDMFEKRFASLIAGSANKRWSHAIQQAFR